MAAAPAAHHQLGNPVEISGSFAEPERRELAALVRSALVDRVQNGRAARIAVRPVSPRLRTMGASFVSVTPDTGTRGPVGSVRAVRPLAVDVVSNACHAAFDDPRWPPLTPDVVDGATVSIDVVGPLSQLPSSTYDAVVDAVRVGRDGLVLALEGNTFTFLPDVWQTSRDAVDFVALLWRKAGLEPGDLPSRSRLATFTTETYHLPLMS